jgi:FkbM family methyltransferase
MLRRVSYGQTGQDVLADYILRKYRKVPPTSDYKGVFVDVGCCFPIKASNTYFFYERGWRGICIDANPAMAEGFRKHRPEDKFVLAGVGSEETTKPFYTFTNPQWNTFDVRRSIKMAKVFLGEIEVKIRRLEHILDELLESGQKIDFLSLDIEGLELPALESLNLKKYRPSLITMEMICPIGKIHSQDASKYLIQNGYQLLSHTGHDASFLDVSTA